MRSLRKAGLVVHHLLGVAVVGEDEHMGVKLEEARQYLADALVGDLDGLRRGGLVACVADHVAVGVVDDDEAVGVRLQSLQKLVRHVVGVHLRMRGERRGIEAALDLDLVLALAGGRGLAVEEARDVAELLGLGDAELADAGLGYYFAKKVVHAAACAHRSEEVVLELVPVAGEAEEGHLRAGGALTGVVVAYESLGQLDGAVLAVVGVHDHIAVLHAVVAADHIAGNVLVGHRGTVGRDACLILGLDALFDRRGLLALAADDAVVGLARKLPVLDAVHAIVAAHGCTDRRVSDGGQLGFEAGDVLKRRTRGRVASVKERMNDDAALGELGARTLHELEEVLLVGMDALVLKEPEEMELRVVGLPPGDEVLPLRALEELAGREAVVDALQLLDDDAAGAHVEVADLGAALIAVRQADGLAAAVEQAVGIARPDLVDHRGLGAIHGIAVGAGVHTPAVANDEYYWSHLFILSFQINIRPSGAPSASPPPRRPSGAQGAGDSRSCSGRGRGRGRPGRT